MKKIITTVLLFMCYNAQSKVGVTVEAGGGPSNLNSKYKAGFSPLIGASISKSFKLIEFGVGLKYWGASYTGTQELLGVNAEPLGDVEYSGSTSNLSFPISLGINIPVKKFELLAKGVIAPTLLLNHKYDFDKGGYYGKTPLALEPGTEGYFTAAGVDLGIGYKVSKIVSLGIKYSGLISLNDLKYETTQKSFSPFYKAPQDDRQHQHAGAIFVKISF